MEVKRKIRFQTARLNWQTEQQLINFYCQYHEELFLLKPLEVENRVDLFNYI